MPLSSPVPHRLVEGSIGEVIPAELLQRTAAFGDSTVPSVRRGHRMDFRGYAKHVGLEYASAGACVVLPPWAGRSGHDLLGVDPGEAYRQWSFGFAEAPKLVMEPFFHAPTDTTYRSFFLEWTMHRGAGQACFTACAEYADAATVPGPAPVVLAPNGGRHRAYVGSISLVSGVDGPVTGSHSIQWMRKVIIWGHQ